MNTLVFITKKKIAAWLSVVELNKHNFWNKVLCIDKTKYSSPFGEIQTQHISANPAHQWSSMVAEG